jgi:hypothetical protein
MTQWAVRMATYLLDQLLVHRSVQCSPWTYMKCKSGARRENMRSRHWSRCDKLWSCSQHLRKVSCAKSTLASCTKLRVIRHVVSSNLLNSIAALTLSDQSSSRHSWQNMKNRLSWISPSPQRSETQQSPYRQQCKNVELSRRPTRLKSGLWSPPPSMQLRSRH